MNTMRCLKKLSNEHPNVTQIAAVYAGVMLNLIIEQNTESTANLLEKLSNEQVYMLEIIVEYVNGQLNLIIKQDEPGVENIQKHLEELTSEHPDVVQIADVITKKLFYLNNK